MPTRQKIRYSDCDAQAIVFNANYPRYWDDALTDWFEENGFGGVDMGGLEAEVVTARMEMDFRASATLGDTLETAVEVERLGNTSMTVGLSTTRLSDGILVVEGREVLVFVDQGSHRPTAVPERVLRVLGRESNPQG
jgi:acyl-CoA thioester hydrolase